METRFLLSAPRVELLPELGLSEVAFLGRSNVGKSSLLNALIQAKVARTSQTPGRTQAVNLFRVHAGFGDFALADLPGYGYAKAPKALRSTWGPLTQRYLRDREPLAMVMLLLDARRDPSIEDQRALGEITTALRDRSVVIQGIVTKLDKLSKAQRKPAMSKLSQSLGLETPLLGTSASNRIGLEDVWGKIRTIIGPKATSSSSR